ncbi:MAG: ABC transporter substrate-binding protein [Clostridiales bacterium]|nr:ABC transporter substrate-binding protein [Clostridiales bacterium]
MKKLFVMVLCLALVLSTGSAFAEVIKLGGLAPLTGTYTEYGTGFEIAFNMAIDEINAAGGVNGYTFEIDVQDSEGDPVVSTTLATRFAEDDSVLAWLGDFTSGACKANAEICDLYGITQLSPTASAPDYASMSPYCFSIMGRQDIEAPFLAKYIVGKYLGCKTAAVIRVDSDWGLASYSNFEKKAVAEGIEIVAHETYQTGETDFSSIVTKVRASNPDCLIVLDQGNSVAAVFNQADADGWDIRHVALGPGTSAQLLGQLTDPANIIVTSPFFFDKDNADVMAWHDAFKAKSGFAPTIHPACAYDCVYLIAEAVKSIGDGELNRQTLRDALQNVEYDGLTGFIKFTPDGDISRNYMICGGTAEGWVVLEGFEYGAAGL